MWAIITPMQKTKLPSWTTKLKNGPDIHRVGMLLPGYPIPEAYQEKLEQLAQHIVVSGYRLIMVPQAGSVPAIFKAASKFNPGLVELMCVIDDYIMDCYTEGNIAYQARAHTKDERALARAISPEDFLKLNNRQQLARAANVRIVGSCDYINVLPRCWIPGWGRVGHGIRTALHFGRPVFHALSGNRISEDETSELVTTKDKAKTDERWGFLAGQPSSAT